MKDTISTIAILILVIAILNLIFSVAIYYLLPDYKDIWKKIDWFVTGIIAYFILKYFNVSINDHFF